ncbi:TrmH family RNA methyltransferase, partial [Klebsiella pneumoniae]|uniref:TrmH family RNA methyltransferase n=1 Tax=Klebsiella pneumoniae TaxID=573 RepID=UPI003852001C
WEYSPSTVEVISRLKGEGYRVYAIEQVEGSISLEKLETDADKIAVVFGNEVEGVSNEVLSICDGCIEIPQMGMKHSLN